MNKKQLISIVLSTLVGSFLCRLIDKQLEKKQQVAMEEEHCNCECTQCVDKEEQEVVEI